jgi:hypothetical protein
VIHAGAIPPGKATPPVHGIPPPNLPSLPRPVRTQGSKMGAAQDVSVPMDVHPAAPLAATAAQYANHAANMLYSTPFPGPQAGGSAADAAKLPRNSSDISLDSGQTTPLQASPLRGS